MGNNWPGQPLPKKVKANPAGDPNWPNAPVAVPAGVAATDGQD